MYDNPLYWRPAVGIRYPGNTSRTVLATLALRSRDSFLSLGGQLRTPRCIRNRIRRRMVMAVLADALANNIVTRGQLATSDETVTDEYYNSRTPASEFAHVST